MMLLLIILALALGEISCDTRVIGGQYAGRGQFPHQVSLQLRGRHHCGGSIISERWILTAAHCTARRNVADLRIVAGTTDLSANDGRVFRVAQYIMHPQYNSKNLDYDLSLIRLSQPIPLGGRMQKISLAPQGTNHAAHTMATVSGFGATNSNLQMSNRLIFANVPLWSRDFCNPKNIPGITDRMICAGHPSGQVNSCKGDSGSPLTVKNELFGVVSWGFGCGARDRPAIYTYVGGLRNWIQHVSGI